MSERALLIPLALGIVVIAATPTTPPPAWLPLDPNGDLFRTSDRCIACHKGVTTSAGLDVSIAYDWRASMMANSARDPYWQAAVRRELIDHPEAAAAIEDNCSRCHMPMANVTAQADGRTGSVFANLPGGDGTETEKALAVDGVSCAVCHQVQPDGLGEESSFTGGFTISEHVPEEGRSVFGPFEPDEGGAGIMHSATGFRPTEGLHVQTSELCASCHTLFTHSVRDDGGEGPEFPEQGPYLEWRASSYAAEGEMGESCQDCHMPAVQEDVPVTDVLGRARADVSRHVFQGGNFFMLRLLNRYRDELGVTALPQEMALAADRTEAHLRSSTASVEIQSASLEGDRLRIDVSVQNRAGHKFPTAYPSRRAWLHLTVDDRDGRRVFDSGAFSPDGSIVGNDHDEDGSRYEPHYEEISEATQVQVYEAVMVDQRGAVTTGLMSAERWVKDNRLLPAGFDASRADGRVSVHGAATSDASFTAGGDEVRYRVQVSPDAGPFTVTVELWFQPIAYRWAQNLSEYDSFETDRFVRYYESMAAASALIVARTRAVVR
ncbi:MAG: hypothetical protein IIB36_18160 [Gemmatimonadetes bacterium]|nr:hypothetical protein [Gemmatimonadota bacterium]